MEIKPPQHETERGGVQNVPSTAKAQRRGGGATSHDCLSGTPRRRAAAQVTAKERKARSKTSVTVSAKRENERRKRWSRQRPGATGTTPRFRGSGRCLYSVESARPKRRREQRAAQVEHGVACEGQQQPRLCTRAPEHAPASTGPVRLLRGASGLRGRALSSAGCVAAPASIREQTPLVRKGVSIVCLQHPIVASRQVVEAPTGQVPPEATWKDEVA